MRVHVEAFLAFVVLCSAVALAPAAEADQGGCGNQAIRLQQGAGFLPDCRAYEMVTPADKNGTDVYLPTGQNFSGLKTTVPERQVGWFNVSRDGERVTYGTAGAFSDPVAAPVTSGYVARRSQQGWSSDAVSPPYASFKPGLDLDDQPAFLETDDDLDAALFRQPPRQAPLTPEAPAGHYGYYIRDLHNGSYRLLLSKGRAVAGVADDLSRVVYFPHPRPEGEDPAPLLEAFFDSEGNVHERVVSIVGGQPVTAYPIGAMIADTQHERMMSADGSRIIFNDTTTPAGNCGTALQASGWAMPFTCTLEHIYVREDGQSTRLISGSAPGVPADPLAGPGVSYWGTDRNVSSIFFAAQARLTADSTASHDPGDGVSTGSFGDLYRYDLDADGGAGRLTDITVDPSSAEGAQVIGVLGVSEDGRRAYFVARSNRLDGEQGVAGQANLYLWDGRGQSPTTTFIATLQAPQSREEIGDAMNWNRPNYMQAAQLTPDGGHLVFSSKNRLTAYDNDGHAQVYLYSADDDVLRCASCFGPQPATGDAFIPQEKQFDTTTQTRPGRAITDDGERVFFSAVQSLVPGSDANQAVDVYEYDAAADRVGLLSGGRDPDQSYLLGSDRSGDNVFFVTRAALAAGDLDANVDIYDARVGGGILVPSSPPPCSGDDCQQAPNAAPSFRLPGSVISGAEKGPPAPLLRLGKATPRGRAVSIRLAVDAPGRVYASGARVSQTERRVGRSGSYALRVPLKPSARRQLAARGSIAVKVRVRFVPEPGPPATSVARVTLKSGAGR